jgi:hypothetical protein
MNKFGQINRVEDLDQALDPSQFALVESEWRIHFHIPLHTSPEKPLQSTSDHTQDTLDYLIKNPHTTKHIGIGDLYLGGFTFPIQRTLSGRTNGTGIPLGLEYPES